MPPSTFGIGPGAILVGTIVRTVLAIVLSVRSHSRGETRPSMALQALSDGILALGVVLYVSGGVGPETPRLLMAALLVFALTWEAFAVVVRSSDTDTPAWETDLFPMDGLIAFGRGWVWFMGAMMMALLSGSVVALRPEMTDSQKLAPIVGGSVPIIVGLYLGAYACERDPDKWTVTDTVVAVLVAATLAFACWAWL